LDLVESPAVVPLGLLNPQWKLLGFWNPAEEELVGLVGTHRRSSSGCNVTPRNPHLKCIAGAVQKTSRMSVITWKPKLTRASLR